ncbi:OmpA family protein [Streptomyces sp. NPDC057445]|uniref:OmpA family protein n=1 Tax=Streptomyces sp. NPDC057445 TaxID=3346136 RepID=UPI00367D059F
MNRHTTVLLPAALLLTLTGFAAFAVPAQADDGQLRPGATLAPPVIKDLRLVTADITTVSGTVDDRREDTTGQTTVTLGARILFGKDSATLTDAARARIRAVAGEIRSQHATKATIAGYTDDLGSAAHGLTLSRRRAEAVRDVLGHELGTGVTYTVKGFGEAHPVADNKTEPGREKNRRVTISFPRQP